MTIKTWMEPLKKAVERVTGQEVYQRSYNDLNQKVKSELGADDRVFDKQLNHLILGFDVSEPVDLAVDYAEVLDYISGLFGGIHRRFKRIHIYFWAENYYVEKPFSFYRPDLLKIADESFKEAINEIKSSKALASSIINPYFTNSVWKRLHPDLLMIFTRGKFENDLDNKQLSRFDRYRDQIIWLLISDQGNPDPSKILSIDSRSEKRIVSVLK
ncbi:MAG: hypothetical protein U1E11_03240 [Dethiobacteria bacterium]|nr:hypothetical protein [Dethiobacteria bacterium]